MLWGMAIALVLYGIACFGCGAVSFLLGVVSLAVFLWAMLIDCLKRPFLEGETRRLLYAALIVALVPAGAVLYYFRVVRPGARA
jgi:hypothetical protein